MHAYTQVNTKIDVRPLLGEICYLYANVKLTLDCFRVYNRLSPLNFRSKSVKISRYGNSKGPAELPRHLLYLYLVHKLFALREGFEACAAAFEVRITNLRNKKNEYNVGVLEYSKLWSLLRALIIYSK